MPNLKPINKRFPGQYTIRSTMWIPDKDNPGYKLGFEGWLDPVVAEAILALQIHQDALTDEMKAQLRAMTEQLNKTKG